MELITKLAWALLALIHLSPAAVFFLPHLTKKLYGIDANGDLGVLITHRGALFLAIFAACVAGALDPAARRALSVVVAISVISFLWLYFRAGMPSGPLKTIALVDLVGLAPLLLVVWSAWRFGANQAV
ncbi:hypothetical protein MCEMIH15_01470 [Caulobacteraceae bacterium]|jgi:hypothetical protein